MKTSVTLMFLMQIPFLSYKFQNVAYASNSKCTVKYISGAKLIRENTHSEYFYALFI